MRRLTVALLALLALLLASTGSTASAGGWAVASLDELPPALAGQRTTVGFTILQHGVTPVDLSNDPANPVGIEIARADGSTDFFPAIADGRVGHYLATVDFPAAGSYEWSVRMGWFGPQSLGTLEVRSRVTTPASSAWPTVRVAMVSLTVVLAVVAIGDVVAGRRRRRLALP